MVSPKQGNHKKFGCTWASLITTGGPCAPRSETPTVHVVPVLPGSPPLTTRTKCLLSRLLTWDISLHDVIISTFIFISTVWPSTVSTQMAMGSSVTSWAPAKCVFGCLRAAWEISWAQDLGHLPHQPAPGVSSWSCSTGDRVGMW